jgi:hypothetical protein
MHDSGYGGGSPCVLSFLWMYANIWFVNLIHEDGSVQCALRSLYLHSRFSVGFDIGHKL